MNLKKKIAVTQKLCNKVQAVHTLEKKKQKTELFKSFKSCFCKIFCMRY